MSDTDTPEAATARHSTTADRAEFQALLDRWAQAIVANDADAIGEFCTPDWELIDAPGVIPLERFLHVVRSGALTHAEMSHEVLSVRREAEVAVVVTHGTNHGTWQGEPFSADEWTTEFFVRRDGHWRCRLTVLTPRRPR